MNGLVEIKYYNDDVKIAYKIDEIEVSEEEFFDKLNKMNNITIKHIKYPLAPEWGNHYGWEYILENVQSFPLLFSNAIFSNGWAWAGLGLTDYKMIYEQIPLNNTHEGFDLESVVKSLINEDEENILDLIEQYSDEFLCEFEIIKEIAKNKGIDENSEEFYDKYTELLEEIEDYLKKKYAKEKNYVINVWDEENNITASVVIIKINY